MRFIALSGLLLALALCALVALAAEQNAANMVDPLMGLSFDPEEVRFQPLPRSVATIKTLGQGNQWIFARHRRRTSTIYIVAGWQKVYSDPSGNNLLEPGFGAVIKISGTRIEVLGVPDRLFDQNAILPRDVVNSLMRDAAERYIMAFGGASKLQQSMTAQGIVADMVPPALVDALATRGTVVSITPKK